MSLFVFNSLTVQLSCEIWDTKAIITPRTTWFFVIQSQQNTNKKKRKEKKIQTFSHTTKWTWEPTHRTFVSL